MKSTKEMLTMYHCLNYDQPSDNLYACSFMYIEYLINFMFYFGTCLPFTRNGFFVIIAPSSCAYITRILLPLRLYLFFTFGDIINLIKENC